MPWVAGSSSPCAATCASHRRAPGWGMPEVRLAVLPGSGGTQRLPRIVGPARAKELILTGRIIGADEAERIGLVNEVVPAGEARARADAVADEIAARGPLAVREAKRLIDAALEAGPGRGPGRRAGRVGTHLRQRGHAGRSEGVLREA